MNKYMNSNKYLSLVALMGLAAGLALARPVFAQTTMSRGFPHSGKMWGGDGAHGRTPGVFGTVSGVSGTTLTVTDSRANTTYSVDATNAQVMKNGTSSSVSAIAVGDMVMVQGTVSGSSVVATMIRDGIGMEGGRMMWGKAKGAGPEQNLVVQGNGQPVIGGNVTAINGTTLTIANKSNVTYTVDVSGAKIIKMGTSTPLSSVATGDKVIVQGAVNGTSITASSVIDQGSKLTVPGGPTPANSGAPKRRIGFFGSIGNFFSHLFGF